MGDSERFWESARLDYDIYVLGTMYVSISENLSYLYQINHIYQPQDRAEYDTRSIFKRSLTGLNSEYSFS